MADIDTRELGLDKTLIEASFKKTAPGATPAHTNAVNKLHSQIMDVTHPEVQNNLGVETKDVPKLPDMIQVIDHNIDGDKSTGSLIRNPDQLRRYNQAVDAAELAYNFIDKGYAHLTIGQKRQLQERVLPAMMRFVPELNTAFGSMNRRDRQKAMDDILADPEFQKQVNTLLGGILDKYQNPSELNKGNHDEVKRKYDEKLLEQTKTNREYTAAVRHQAEFTGGGTKAATLAALPPSGVLEAQHARAERELTLLKNELTRTNEDIRTHQRNANYAGTDAAKLALAATAAAALPGLEARRQRLEQVEMPDKEREKGIFDAQKKTREALEAEKTKAEKDEQDVLNRKDQIDHEVADLYRELLTAQAELGINKLDKAAKEKDLVTDLQNVFAQAAENVVRGRMEAADTAKKELLKSLPNGALGHGLEARYLDTDGHIKKELVKEDYKKLLEFKSNDLAVEALVAGGMSEAEAKAMLASNKEFAKEAKTKAASEVLARYIQSGNKMKPEEARRLLASDIGEAVVGEAMDKNKHLDAKLKEMQALLPEEKKDEHGNHGHKGGWSEVLKKLKLPKPTMQQLLTVSLLAAGGFYAGPTILNYLIPTINHAAARWVNFYRSNPGVKNVVDTTKAGIQNIPQPNIPAVPSIIPRRPAV